MKWAAARTLHIVGHFFGSVARIRGLEDLVVRNYLGLAPQALYLRLLRRLEVEVE